MNLEWEQIDAYHKRAKVIGGWLVKAYEDVLSTSPQQMYMGRTGYEWRIAMCFVPDANYEWRIND